jgi:RimJ/RimL family protein N-acetyltransferase
MLETNAFSSGKTFEIPTIKTERLVLRPCRLDDFDAVNLYAQLPEVCRYIRPAEGDDRVRKVVQSLSTGWRFELDQWSGIMITLPEEDKPIGDFVFKVDDMPSKRLEIGYRLSPKYAGLGFVSEVVGEMFNRLFNQFDVHKVVARCDPRNVASYKIMEKLGMKREAYFKQHYMNGDQLTDQLDYGITAQEWRLLSPTLSD